MTDEERCQWCFHSLVGAPIPDSDGEFYSKKIGIEIPRIYDGTLFWQCPYCDRRWHRWPKHTHLWYAAERYVDAR